MDLVWISNRDGDLTEDPVKSAEVILESLASGSTVGEAIIQPRESTSPRMLISHHGAAGFQLMCCESEFSWGDCLAWNSTMSEPTIEIELGGQAIELWPAELFVNQALASDALDWFLERGEELRELVWVPLDSFPRRSLWEAGS
ncbi:MAG: hypothetical protein WD942_09855 [Dehalococcoidia bacterium]